MQVSLNSAIYKSNFYNRKQETLKFSQNPIEYVSDYPITFQGAQNVNKTMTSKIAHEKSKLMKQINDILAQEVPVLTNKEKLNMVIKQVSNIIKTRNKRLKELEIELNATINSPYLNQQQKNDRAAQLHKEYNRLNKLKVQEPVEKEPSKDNYDFALINKFKTAILDDNYDLAKIEEEHYKDIANIETVSKFKKKYPSIRIPADPRDIIVKKILDTLDRSFYFDLYSVFIKENDEEMANEIMSFFQDYFNKLSEQFENKTGEDLLNLFCIDVSRVVIANLEKKRFADNIANSMEIKDKRYEDNFDSIPVNRKDSIAKISENDKLLLDIDYDSYILDTIKKLYLDNEKLNQIEYSEGDKKIKVSTIKSKEYQFEKIPDKMKRLISDAQKIQTMQRDYKNFTSAELKSRLTYYTATDIGEDDKIFNLIVDFDTCKFTEEDKIYLIKFLELLDKISDEKITIQEAVDDIEKNKIHPRGTLKLNEIERKKAKEKIQEEKQKLLALNNLRGEFNQIINSLYESELSVVADKLIKYYPISLDENTIKETNKIVEIVKKSLESKNIDEIKQNITRWEIYHEYSKTDSNAEEYIKAINYAKNFPTELDQRAGQYLLNRELIDTYPTSAKIVTNPVVFSKIMERFGNNKDLATIYLCKYEDYALMNDNEKGSILSLLKHFDYKNYDDRIILKNIVEEDYINNETILKANENGQDLKVAIAPKAKKAILDKYKFPGCIDLFVSFEEALSMRARETGTAGIKKTGANNDALDYKMEVKIKGRTDRLFSSKNDYVFDIYSERGLH